MNEEPHAGPFVELHYPLKGQSLPSDHAYGLYAAIATHIPDVHGASWLAIHSVKGRVVNPGKLRLGKFAKLRLRIPLEKTPVMYKLAGADLTVFGYEIKLGIPEVRMLRPSNRLRSRMVSVKVAHSEGKSAEASTFVRTVKKQLEEIGVTAELSLERTLTPALSKDEFARRVVRIKNKIITGYGVILSGLSDEDSLRVQEVGLGGRRRMGCGIFDPLGE